MARASVLHVWERSDRLTQIAVADSGSRDNSRSDEAKHCVLTVALLSVDCVLSLLSGESSDPKPSPLALA